MLDWEGRILDNTSIQVVKAALPFLDVPVGESVDLEGLLRAVRNFFGGASQKRIDMILQIFMMKRAFGFFKIFQEMNQAGEEESPEKRSERLFDLLKEQIPEEQRDMIDLWQMMFQASEEETHPDESEGHIFEHASSESEDYEGTRGEDQGETTEEYSTADYGGISATEGTEPFLSGGRSTGAFGDFDKGYE